MYEKLFATGMIGSVEIKNRIVMPPMGTSLSSFTGEATDEVIRYYEERAKGGCGLNDYLEPGNGPDGDIEHHTEIPLPS